jgi:hypothetical protein
MIDDNDIKKLKTIFATKDDLKNFATKDDLKYLASKSELNDSVRKLENKIESSNKKLYSKIFNLIDPLAREIHDSRESRRIFSYRIEDHESRIKTLES